MRAAGARRRRGDRMADLLPSEHVAGRRGLRKLRQFLRGGAEGDRSKQNRGNEKLHGTPLFQRIKIGGDGARLLFGKAGVLHRVARQHALGITQPAHEIARSIREVAGDDLLPSEAIERGADASIRPHDARHAVAGTAAGGDQRLGV